MEILKIHEFPEYVDQCCDLINLEWPRSRTARLRSLESSCDSFPTCLILVDGGKVIGHSKLTPIPSIPNGCFVESVVIHPTLRGNGLGKLLMAGTEEYAKSCGLDSVYLSTIDKQGFYLKIGYEYCPPVSIYGSMIFGHNFKTKAFSAPQSEKNCCGRDIKPVPSEKTKSKLLQENGPLPPPPPPPAPLLSLSQQKVESGTVTSSKKSSKLFMKKELNKHF